MLTREGCRGKDADLSNFGNDLSRYLRLKSKDSRLKTKGTVHKHSTVAGKVVAHGGKVSNSEAAVHSLMEGRSAKYLKF